jgi:hypothetical protein
MINREFGGTRTVGRKIDLETRTTAIITNVATTNFRKFRLKRT